MDILIIVFGFIAAFVISVVGITRDKFVFIICGGSLFMILGMLLFSSPLETISGSYTIENITATNVTAINTSLTFTALSSTFNTPLALFFVVFGLFLVLWGFFKALHDED